jgi:hypothetical protein
MKIAQAILCYHSFVEWNISRELVRPDKMSCPSWMGTNAWNKAPSFWYSKLARFMELLCMKTART